MAGRGKSGGHSRSEYLQGFHSFYDNIIFNNDANRFLLAGGTGKSSFRSRGVRIFKPWLRCGVPPLLVRPEPHFDAVVVRRKRRY